MFNRYQEMIEIRKENPALMYGNYFEPFKDNSLYVQGFVRSYTYEDYSQAVLVLHNLTSDEVTVDIEYLEFILGDSLTIEGYQTLIVSIDPNEIEAYI